MTLFVSLGGLLATLALALLIAGAGALFLRLLKVEVKSGEAVLFSLGAGAVILEVFVSVGELVQNVRTGVCAAAALTVVLGLFGAGSIARTLWQSIAKLRQQPNSERWLVRCLAVVLFLQGLAAMAPLTGSDALHYHFTIPAQILREGFRANWSEPHSFVIGQSHQLILAGLALGSERIALGLIFVGGAAAALSIVVLAREWTTGALPWVAAITFVLTPVVFWQMTTAGAPDIWMAFFAPISVLAIIRAAQHKEIGYSLLAGIFAGAIAGTKYTGLIFALLILVSFVMETRSVLRGLVFSLSAVAAGSWPYARNWAWTGDPVFPFFLQYFPLRYVNAHVVAFFMADTGASKAHGFWRIFEFPFFAGIEPSQLGFWQMLGPLVLCFAPVLLLAVKNTPAWRVALLVWIGGALGTGATSGMLRFALPVLSIALAAVFAGISSLQECSWRKAKAVTALCIAAYVAIGFGGLLLYARPQLAAATGVVSREEYLQRRAPDYYKTQFVNEHLAGMPGNGKVLIAFRHTYYVKPFFLNGNSDENWLLDPSLLPAANDLFKFLRRENVRWIFRENEYPEQFQMQYRQLEAQGKLVPCGSGVGRDFENNRINDSRGSQSLTLLCVSTQSSF